jgi:hypothetical protein
MRNGSRDRLASCTDPEPSARVPRAETQHAARVGLRSVEVLERRRAVDLCPHHAEQVGYGRGRSRRAGRLQHGAPTHLGRSRGTRCRRSGRQGLERRCAAEDQLGLAIAARGGVVVGACAVGERDRVHLAPGDRLRLRGRGHRVVTGPARGDAEHATQEPQPDQDEAGDTHRCGSRAAHRSRPGGGETRSPLTSSGDQRRDHCCRGATSSALTHGQGLLRRGSRRIHRTGDEARTGQHEQDSKYESLRRS